MGLYVLSTTNVISRWVLTHGDFIMLPHWETIKGHHDLIDIRLSHIILTLRFLTVFSYLNNSTTPARHGSIINSFDLILIMPSTWLGMETGRCGWDDCSRKPSQANDSGTSPVMVRSVGSNLTPRSQNGTYGRVKPMTYKIDTCCFLARCSALLGEGKDWLAQCEDNVIEWDFRSWCRWPGFPVGQHYDEIAISARCQKSVPIVI